MECYPGADLEFEGLSGAHAEPRHFRSRNLWVKIILGDNSEAVVVVEHVGEELPSRERADRVLELLHSCLQVADRA